MSLQLIQAELKAPKGQTNDFGKYKYRSCEDILEAVKPLLKKHDCVLTLSDEMIEVGGRVYVKATANFVHVGKGMIEVTACAREAETKKGMDDAQITGAASSYARKYALNGLFCIDDTKDADATNQHGKEKEYKNPHEDASKKNEAVKDTFKARLNGAKSMEELDSAMKECEACFNTWPDAWIDGMNKLFVKREKELK